MAVIGIAQRRALRHISDGATRRANAKLPLTTTVLGETTMADLSLRNLALQETPHFPIDYPASSPDMLQQRLLAAKAEEWAAWGTPPPMLDTIIELLDWYDGDPDLELIDADLEDEEGAGHIADPLASQRQWITAGDCRFAMPGDYAVECCPGGVDYAPFGV